MTRFTSSSRLLPITPIQLKKPRPQLEAPPPCNLRSRSFLAPARPQICYSSLICLSTSLTDGRIPSKTPALQCLQISQDVKMIKEFTLFLLSLTLRIVLAHQLATEHSLLCGVATPTWSGDKMANQTCLEKTHLVRRF
jgi:hypothetical protein